MGSWVRAPSGSLKYIAKSLEASGFAISLHLDFPGRRQQLKVKLYRGGLLLCLYVRWLINASITLYKENSSFFLLLHLFEMIVSIDVYSASSRWMSDSRA